MSIVCTLIEVDEDQIGDLLDDPEGTLDILDELEEEGEAETIDLDKAWHGIHFLLTGAAWRGEEPLCYLIKGGVESGEEDFGYGPVRVLTPDQVENWANALSAISTDELRKRFNPDALMKAKVYPKNWDQAPGEDNTLEYLLEYYEVLRSFVEQTKEENRGVIIYIS